MDFVQQSRPLTRTRPVRRTRLQQEARMGLLFLSPWVIGFVLLKALPILAAFIFSLTDFRMLAPEETKFVGLQNYLRFFSDTQAGASLFGSLSYFLLTVPLQMVVALGLAAIFTSDRLRNKRLSQTLIFMTSIIPSTSIFFIFLGSLQYADRLIFTPNNLPPLQGFGLLVPFMALWSIGPGFLIMYSAMESVPAQIYEAARVDGAGPFARFVYITLPMISPAIFFRIGDQPDRRLWRLTPSGSGLYLELQSFPHGELYQQHHVSRGRPGLCQRPCLGYLCNDDDDHDPAVPLVQTLGLFS